MSPFCFHSAKNFEPVNKEEQQNEEGMDIYFTQKIKHQMRFCYFWC